MKRHKSLHSGAIFLTSQLGNHSKCCKGERRRRRMSNEFWNDFRNGFSLAVAAWSFGDLRYLVFRSVKALLSYGLKIDSWLDLGIVTPHASTSIVVSQFYHRDLLTYIIKLVPDLIQLAKINLARINYLCTPFYLSLGHVLLFGSSKWILHVREPIVTAVPEY